MKIQKAIRLLALSAAILVLGTAKAQDNGLIGQGITLAVIVPEQEDPFPSGAESYLSNKLTQVAVNNGIAAGRDFSRFFIAAHVAMANKDIVPGPPQQISQNMEITLYIADYFDKKIYSSTTVNAVGVGTNITKCIINGLKNMPVNSPQMKNFVETGKDKILAYYRQQADRIIQQAETLAAQHRYDEAFFLLTSIPDAVGESFDKAMAATLRIYQSYVDRLCDENLAKARAAWAANQNSAGATEAGAFLSQIYPDAKCYGDAMSLYGEIKGKVLDDWKFEMKKWQDGVDLESQRIGAMRDIGVAFGNGQQPTTYTGLGWLLR
ncbi:MAG: hypothetical protein NC396_05775 [Bacteroides sp.]|nr:hypothetical protein [Bacteroides sp.]MCM1085863.1 hypothetical protein [Bacteroides sp.]